MTVLGNATRFRKLLSGNRTAAAELSRNASNTSLPSEAISAQVRLALFSGNYNYVKDGAAVALNRLVAFLERQGIEVLIFSPTVKHAAMEPVGTVVSVPSLPIPKRSEYRIALGLPGSARKRLADFRPNLFHLSTPDLLGHAALRLAHQWRVPAIASFHTRFDTYLQYYGLGHLEGAGKQYLRHFYRQCEQVYAPSQSMAAVLHNEGIAANLRIWSRGVDCTLFNPAKRDFAWREAFGIDSEAIVISFAGRLVREKGLGTFASVLDLLKTRGLRYRTMIIGDGPERNWLAGRLPDATFIGFLSGDDLACAYASSDIFFFPSVTETFGIVTLEAMASGLAVVCANATGSNSLVAHGTTGFLAKPDDIEQFATYLTTLATDPDIRARIGCAARVEAHSHDWDGVMWRLLGHYREVLATYGKAPAMLAKPTAAGALGHARGDIARDISMSTAAAPYRTAPGR
jgi:glycosyltransferase involved in cell wall biosynthesis